MTLSMKPGEILQNRYLIKKIIGRGGMGSVYLADDTLLEGRKCALKEVEYDRSLDEILIKEAQGQFMREATILARLDHPNLPKVSDFFSIEIFLPSLKTIFTESAPRGSELRSKLNIEPLYPVISVNDLSYSFISSFVYAGGFNDAVSFSA